MKIYLIRQKSVTGSDTYDSAVVVASDKLSASHIHPGGDAHWDTNQDCWVDRNGLKYFQDVWVYDPAQVEVLDLGEPDEHVEQGVILASFNAG